MGIERFEKRIEGVVESVFARASRRGIEPVELGRRLIRELERNRKVGVASELAPNVFEIRLSSSDFTQLNPINLAVTNELKDLLADSAHERGYRFVGPLFVDIIEDPSQRPGTLSLDSGYLEDEGFRERPVVILPNGRRVPIGDIKLQIGRMPSSSIMIDDPVVSRRHAEIELRGGSVYLRDFGSTNGTFVNAVRITGETPLAHGDVIKIGNTELRFMVE